MDKVLKYRNCSEKKFVSCDLPAIDFNFRGSSVAQCIFFESVVLPELSAVFAKFENDFNDLA